MIIFNKNSNYLKEIMIEFYHEQEEFLTNANIQIKEWFCSNCCNLFESKNEVMNHKKICMKLL